MLKFKRFESKCIDDIERIINDLLISEVLIRLSVYRNENGMYGMIYASRPLRNNEKATGEVLDYRLGDIDNVIKDIETVSRTDYVNNIIIIPPNKWFSYHVAIFTRKEIKNNK